MIFKLLIIMLLFIIFVAVLLAAYQIKDDLVERKEVIKLINEMMNENVLDTTKLDLALLKQRIEELGK